MMNERCVYLRALVDIRRRMNNMRSSTVALNNRDSVRLCMVSRVRSISRQAIRQIGLFLYADQANSRRREMEEDQFLINPDASPNGFNGNCLSLC